MTASERQAVVRRVATVDLKVRYVPSRQAFNPGSVMAWLERPDGTLCGTTRGHAAWEIAAVAALAMANRRGMYVGNEDAIRNRIDGARLERSRNRPMANK